MHYGGCRRSQHPRTTQSLFGSHAQLTESIAHPSSPQTAALASVDPAPESLRASFADLEWVERRFFESGAHTTRHEIEQSTGTVQVLWIVNDTVSSSLSS